MAVKEYTREALEERWRGFLARQGRRTTLLEKAGESEEFAFAIPYADVAIYDPELAMFMLERPLQALIAATKAAEDLIPRTQEARVHVRVVGIRDPLACPDIRDLRQHHLGRLLCLRGIVRRVSEVRPRIRQAVFQCVRCTAVLEVEQPGGVLQEPLECYEDQGGCKRASRSTKFVLLTSPASLTDPFEEPGEGRMLRFSEFTDFQAADLAEPPENLKAGADPQRLPLELEVDLTGRLTPGDRVTVVGILREKMRKGSTVADLFLRVVSFERDRDEADADGRPASPEEEERYHQVAHTGGLVDSLVSCVAPTIYGLELEKEMLLLQLFGGVAKGLPDGTRIRGDIHILLIGDPGTSKSQLLRFLTQLVGRSIYVSGKSASAAGLTSAVVKDDDGRFFLEAGALVLADRGLACVDEFDKMSPQDRDSMHEAMEQQTISSAKAGIVATLPARTTILAAANPKFGRFDWHSNFIEQIELPPALLSRFDAILPFTDKPNSDRDGQLATHVLHAHQYGERLTRADHNPDEPRPAPEDHDKRFDPPLPLEFVRRYIAYARATVYPELTPEAMRRLRDYYVNVRKTGEGDASAVPMTARNLEGLVRFTEASARMRLSPKADLEDADRAIRVTEYYLGKVARTSEGSLDIDIIAGGQSRAQREVKRIAMSILEKQQAAGGIGLTEDELIDAMTAQGVEEGRAREGVSRLRTAGMIYAHDAVHYRTVDRR